MKSIREVYPDIKEDDNNFIWAPSNYNPMIEAEYQIVLEITDDDYQGDSRYLLKDGEKWGHLIVGWGSCSGCDALQACNSFKEIEKLRNVIINDIKWFSSKTEALEFFKTHDWELDWCWGSDLTKKYVEKAKEILGEANDSERR